MRILLDECQPARFAFGFAIVRVPNNRIERLNASAEAVRAGEAIPVARPGLHS